MSSPKIAFLDIETAPGLGYAWAEFETNILDWKRSWYILCFSVKFVGEKGIRTYALPDYPLFKRDKANDKELVKDLWKVLDRADIVVAHNGDRFDVRKSNARFLFHGLKPPSTYKTVDTLKIARSKFKLDSNRLNALGAYLGVGSKLPHTGFHLWKACMNRKTYKAAAWSLMKKYCARDVELLVKVYEKLRPWATSHPNVNMYSGDRASSDRCPNCGSSHVQKRGIEVLRTMRKIKLHCRNCGRWFTGKTIKTPK